LSTRWRGGEVLHRSQKPDGSVIAEGGPIYRTATSTWRRYQTLAKAKSTQNALAVSKQTPILAA